MARRSDHSRDEIREMALGAAAKLVSDQGLAALSARKLAGAIGYTVGTLYLVFRNLDDLIVQLNGRTLDSMYQELAETRDRCRQAQDCILALGHAYIRFAQHNPRRWNALYEHQRPPDDPLPDWYQAKIDRMFRLVKDALDPLAPQRSAAERDMAAHALWSGVHGICILAQTGTLAATGAQSAQALTESLIRNYLAGLTASAAS